MKLKEEAALSQKQANLKKMQSFSINSISSMSDKMLASCSDNPTFKVSLKAAKYWSLIRDTVKVSTFIGEKGLISSATDEKVFLAILSLHKGNRQRLMFSEIFSLLCR